MDLKIRRGLWEIDKDVYDMTAAHLSARLAHVHKELDTLQPKVPNPEKLISKSIEKLNRLGSLGLLVL